MEQAHQIELLRRLADLVAQRSTTRSDTPTAIPVEHYTSPERLDRERAALFRGCPVVLADVAQLAQPGQYVTHDALGVPLLLCRTAEGEIRCHINVCRHRGSRLVEGLSGAVRNVFRCPYHAWTYGLDGALRHVPHEGDFAPETRAERGLCAAPLQVRHGLVFSAPGAVELDAFLGPLGPELASWGLDRLQVLESHAKPLDANWKLLIDGGLEAYHFRTAHARTVGPLFHDNIALVDSFSPHVRLIFPKRTIEAYLDQDPAKWSLLSAANIIYLIFPNTVLLFQKDRVSRMSVFPETPDRSLRVWTVLAERLPEDEKERAFAAESTRLVETTLEEDFVLAASIQRGLRSGANRALTFGRAEIGLRHFHDAIATRLVQGAIQV